MFERFTDRARRAVVLAQEEARLLDHHHIGTEHLLLGLIHESEGLAAQALNSLNVDLETTREGVVAEVGGRGTTTPMGRIPFTPRAKKCLERSLREALRLGHNYIGTEHLLLGLLREEEGIAARLLTRRVGDLAFVRDRVSSYMQGLAQAAGAEGVYVPSPGPPTEETDLRRKMERELNTLLDKIERERLTPNRPLQQDAESPHCGGCGADLRSSASYRILQVPEQDGEGQASVLFVFCRSCGHTLDSLVAPEDG